MDLIYPKAILDLAPQDKQGYAPGYPSPQPKEGFVLHSMVGGYAAARARLMGPDRASWHFSVLKDGTVYQHFRDPRAVAWHCGVLGDLDTFTAAVGNLTLFGIEHEGGAYPNYSEPLTGNAINSTIDLQRWLYSEIPELKPPALWKSHWEHNWLSSTACPSGRFTNLWTTILTALKEDWMAQLSDRAIQGLERMFGTSLQTIYGAHFGNPGEADKYYFAGREDWTPSMAIEAFSIWGDFTHFANFYNSFAELKKAIADLKALVEASGSGTIPAALVTAIEDINVQLQNPPLAQIAKAVNDELAKRQQT